MTDMSDEARRPLGGMNAGLCDSCRWQRIVTSGKGSTFSRCAKSETDPRFPRYPALPVRTCDGYALKP